MNLVNDMELNEQSGHIIIGYNIHGWDFHFMFQRCQELNCVDKFTKLSRNKDERCIKETF